MQHIHIQGNILEQNRFLFRIFIVIMILEFVIIFLNYYRILLIPFSFDNVQEMQIYISIISLFSFIIHPILVLIGFYNLGKKIDLKSNLKSVILRLLIGAYLGQFFSITVLNFIGICFIEGFNFYWLSYFGFIFSTVFLGAFFTSFTALAIAYLKQNDYSSKS
jgi:hypothetical protein